MLVEGFKLVLDVLPLSNMVFVKLSYGAQKCHKWYFLAYKEGRLELVFEGNFAKYIWKYLQNASSVCKW